MTQSLIHPCDRPPRHGRNRDDPAKPDTAFRALVREALELVVGGLDDPASLKPAFASVNGAFVVMNGKDLNRLESNALDRSRAFKPLQLR